MQSVTSSELRLRVSELIGQLQAGDVVLIRRRFESLALLTLPSTEDTQQLTTAITVRAFRERTSEHLGKVRAGEKIFLRSRHKVTAVLSPVPENFGVTASSNAKATCSVIFRNLAPTQLQQLLKVFTPHLCELEKQGVNLEFC